MIIDEAFQSDDIGEAEQIARRVYPRAELRDSTGGHFHYEHLARGADGINFTRFKLNSQMDIAVEFDNVAAFGVRIAGRYAVESNDHRVGSSQPFLFTPGPGSSTSERLDVLMINVDTDVLAHSAARHLGVDHVRLRFDRHEPTSPAMRALRGEPGRHPAGLSAGARRVRGADSGCAIRTSASRELDRMPAHPLH